MMHKGIIVFWLTRSSVEYLSVNDYVGNANVWRTGDSIQALDSAEQTLLSWPQLGKLLAGYDFAGSAFCCDRSWHNTVGSNIYYVYLAGLLHASGKGVAMKH